MQDCCHKLGRMAAVLVVVMAFAASLWGGTPWKVNNVVVCFGYGTCQVVDTSNNSVTVLDQISDSAAIASPGGTLGVAINNTLHVLVTDATSSNNQANVVEYQIAGKDPLGNDVPHGVSTVFNLNGPGNAAAVALDNAGDMFLLNATNPPNIIELNPAGSVTSTIPLSSSCATQVSSMDLSSAGTSAYVTSQGTIKNVLLSGSTCNLFANLGSGVTFYGIKDIPASAQPVSCNSGGNPCPDETVLVMAIGLFDSNGNGSIDSGDVNVCTGTVGAAAVSCALLLDTGGPGLTSPPWQANNRYSVGQKILDLNLHVQVVSAVSSNGRSGRTTPNWSTNGTTTIDNNVTWQDLGTSVLARYPVSGQTTLRALALGPLVGPTGLPQTCINGNCTASGRLVGSFWMADSASGKFYQQAFAGGQFSFSVTVPACPGCTGIQSIGVYGGEDAAQPGLVSLGPDITLSGNGTTIPATFTFAPDGSDINTLQLTGYNFTGNIVSITGYASAINAASGISDTLLTPTPPPNLPLSAPPAQCTPTTFPPNGVARQCVVWQLDHSVVLPACTNLSTCAFVAGQLEYPGASPANPNFNVISAVDEQYDVTDSVDTIYHSTNSQISLHNTGNANSQASCTYGSPLSPDFFSAPACFTNTRNNIPFKFTCTNLPTGITQANLLPFLHIVQSSQTGGPITEPLLLLNGTGGTTNYRFDTTGQQWVFNLNNPNLNNPATVNYLACTEDATHQVPAFCTFFNVQSSCP